VGYKAGIHTMAGSSLTMAVWTTCAVLQLSSEEKTLFIRIKEYFEVLLNRVLTLMLSSLKQLSGVNRQIILNTL
jgi:hypothetical protein